MLLQINCVSNDPLNPCCCCCWRCHCPPQGRGCTLHPYRLPHWCRLHYHPADPKRAIPAILGPEVKVWWAFATLKVVTYIELNCICSLFL